MAGDEPAMDALVAAAVEAAEAAGRETPRIVLVPTAAARQRPDLALAHGQRAFRAAGARAGVEVHVEAASILTRDEAADPTLVELLATASLVHLPGGDPDLIPVVMRGTPAWAAILAAVEGGACVAGASAGAMALGERLWTPGGPIDGLALVPGIAVMPHFAPDRLASWRSALGDATSLAWLGLDEQTLVIGRPGSGSWTVAGRGRAHLAPPGTTTPAWSAAAGGRIPVG